MAFQLVLIALASVVQVNLSAKDNGSRSNYDRDESGNIDDRQAIISLLTLLLGCLAGIILCRRYGCCVQKESSDHRIQERAISRGSCRMHSPSVGTAQSPVLASCGSCHEQFGVPPVCSEGSIVSCPHCGTHNSLPATIPRNTAQTIGVPTRTASSTFPARNTTRNYPRPFQQTGTNRSSSTRPYASRCNSQTSRTGTGTESDDKESPSAKPSPSSNMGNMDEASDVGRVSSPLRLGCFDGTWTGASISSDMMTWPDGHISKLHITSQSQFWVRVDGAVHTAKLQHNGTLRWSDGDVWTLCQQSGSRPSRRDVSSTDPGSTQKTSSANLGRSSPRAAYTEGGRGAASQDTNTRSTRQSNAERRAPSPERQRQASASLSRLAQGVILPPPSDLTPKAMQFADAVHKEMLDGIHASETERKALLRDLQRTWHPDKNVEENKDVTTAVFQYINTNSVAFLAGIDVRSLASIELQI